MTMAVLEEQVLAQDYEEELQRRSLRYGRIMSGIAIGVLGAMFINDTVVIKVGALAMTRFVGVIPGAVFLWLSFTWFKTHREWILPAHIFLLTSIMVSCGLFSVGLFQKGLAGSAYGAAGTMEAGVLAVFVFSNGAWKYLWAIVLLPLVLTLVAILICCSPTHVQLTLFYTPFITAACVVAVGVSQSRSAKRNFHMAHLLELHKDELEEKAEALQLANNELQQFASAVAHDLNVPLHAIRTTLQSLDLSCCDEADQRRLSKKMAVTIETADRMSRMIASMLSYARLENCSEDFESVSMDDVFSAVKLNVMSMIEASGAEISADPLPEVWGDRMQLTMLLQELTVNAIKYAKPDESPSIHVSSRDEGDQVRIVVSDHGIGFDPQHKRDVFKPYRQLRTHAKDQGYGLGLASCAKIVKLHEGTISVDAEPGQGCAFAMTLPKPPRVS